MPSLRELQLWMRWVITDPRGASAAIDGKGAVDAECPERYREPEVRCLDAIAEVPPLSRGERLDVYAEAYFARLLEALGTDFPTLAAAAGEARFPILIAEYLKRYPSRTPNLDDVGRKLSHFLDTISPELAEYAAYDWAILESVFAPFAPALDASRLAAVSEAQWQQATFVVDPSLRLVRVGDKRYVVRRGAGREVDAATFRALDEIRGGRTLGDVCAAFREPDAVLRLFGGWVADGVLVDVRF